MSLALHVETEVLEFAVTMAKRAKEGLNTFANVLAYEQVEQDFLSIEIRMCCVVCKLSSTMKFSCTFIIPSFSCISHDSYLRILHRISIQ